MSNGKSEAIGAGDGYSEEEAQRRFEQALKAAVTTAPLPIKDRPRGDPPSDRNARDEVIVLRPRKILRGSN